MMQNALVRLLLADFSQKQRDLDSRANTVWQNVGPDDLFSYPDKNTMMPDEWIGMISGKVRRPEKI